jgi:hypothetical protein
MNEDSTVTAHVFHHGAIGGERSGRVRGAVFDNGAVLTAAAADHHPAGVNGHVEPPVVHDTWRHRLDRRGVLDDHATVRCRGVILANNH